MVITVTGHRPGKGSLTYNYIGAGTRHSRTCLETILNRYKPELVYTGMALGFDTIVAITCFKMSVPYVAVIPFVGQERKWPTKAQNLYKYLLKRAKYIHVTNIDKNITYEEYLKLNIIIKADTYGTIAIWMDKRNQWQTDQLIGPDDFLLSFHDGSLGGTYNCIQYAKSKGKKIINIEPYNL